MLCSFASFSWPCPFRNPPGFSVRRRSCRRRIFCGHPFALQGLHRAARHPALSVALPGASAAVAAPVRPRSSPTAGRRNLLGSGGPRCYLQDKYTTGGMEALGQASLKNAHVEHLGIHSSIVVSDARDAVLPNEKSHSLVTQKLAKHIVSKGSLKR